MSESPQDEHLSYGRHVKKLDKKLVRAAKAILEIMHLIESQRRNLEKGIYSNEREYNATQDCTNGYNGKYDGENYQCKFTQETIENCEKWAEIVQDIASRYKAIDIQTALNIAISSCCTENNSFTQIYNNVDIMIHAKSRLYFALGALLHYDSAYGKSEKWGAIKRRVDTNNLVAENLLAAVHSVSTPDSCEQSLLQVPEAPHLLAAVLAVGKGQLLQWAAKERERHCLVVASLMLYILTIENEKDEDGDDHDDDEFCIDLSNDILNYNSHTQQECRMAIREVMLNESKDWLTLHPVLACSVARICKEMCKAYIDFLLQSDKTSRCQQTFCALIQEILFDVHKDFSGSVGFTGMLYDMDGQMQLQSLPLVSKCVYCSRLYNCNKRDKECEQASTISAIWHIDKLFGGEWTKREHLRHLLECGGGSGNKLGKVCCYARAAVCRHYMIKSTSL